jgi:hypothetical protein
MMPAGEQRTLTAVRTPLPESSPERDRNQLPPRRVHAALVQPGPDPQSSCRPSGIPYVGIQRYFLTTCTAFRRLGFALIAYCFMPDHLHMLVAADSEDADVTAFVKRFKQLTGFARLY